NESGNVAETLSPIFTLEAVRAAIAGRRATRSAGVRAASGNGSAPVRRRSAAPAAVVDTVEQDKYAYYRANRDSLPEDISQHAREISALAQAARSADAVFLVVASGHHCGGGWRTRPPAARRRSRSALPPWGYIIISSRY